jgi:AraC family transcriptional regulator of adaptative response / DNA-3-methyladenine glycosylase II
MNVDPRICSQARLSRDARFDGRFFIGVRSTRIYCRPICPVRTVKEENVRYFPTAAAASDEGYRPCLRCRPESSPGTPAWSGTSTTVARALRLISESEMENQGVEELATRLGVGSRHLRRLFVQHLGATPIAVIKTRRLHFAKKLIDETSLPFYEIALAAGFGCVRRFNSEFLNTYGRTPTQIRKLAPAALVQSKDEYLFYLHFRPPFAWHQLLEFFARRSIPGVEAVESGSYSRTIALNGSFGTFRASMAAGSSAIEVRISFPEPRWLYHIIERVRQIFDLTADPHEIGAHLSIDSLLSGRIKALPGLRVPGCWDGFELAVRAVLGQQISIAGARTLAGRMVESFGTRIGDGVPLTHLFPRPESLTEADIASIGLPKARAETIRMLACNVREKRISFGSIQNPDEFRSRLLDIPGIGAWTAEYIAMRALGDPDAFPANDLGLKRSLSLEDEVEVAKRAESWRPWRAYAVMYLWQREAQTRANGRRPWNLRQDRSLVPAELTRAI